MTQPPVEGLGEQTRERCLEALQAGPLPEIARALEPLKPDPARLVAAVMPNRPLDASWDPVLARAAQTGIQDSGLHAARYLLLTLILDQSLAQLESLPVTADVRYYFLDEFAFAAAPAENSLDCLRPGTQSFPWFCEMVRLERFPAGQLQFVKAGFPRSWLSRMPRADSLRFLYHVYARMKGRGPYYESHNSQRKKFSALFTDKEQRRSMVRMAGVLEKNPAVKGFMGEGWLHSPNLGDASPHLRFMMEINRELLEFGAAFTTLGSAEPDSGFLTGDRRRIAKYQSGEWKPLRGLLLVPREGMIDWARRQAPGL